MEEIKNIFVNMESGDSILVHCLTLTPDEVTAWVKRDIPGDKVIEAYPIKDEEVQYYLFDKRVMCNAKVEAIVRNRIAMNPTSKCV